MPQTIRRTLATIRDFERRAKEARARGEHALAKHYDGLANSLAESIRF